MCGQHFTISKHLAINTSILFVYLCTKLWMLNFETECIDIEVFLLLKISITLQYSSTTDEAINQTKAVVCNKNK